MKTTRTLFDRSIHFRVALFAICIALTQGVSVAGSAPQQPASSDGWVVLPVDDYRALRNAAFPSPPEPEAPPVEATLTRIDYDMKIDGELATGEARLTIDVIKDGWVRIAIPPELMVRHAELNGQPVSLVSQPEKNDSRYLLLSRSGRSILIMTIVAAVSSTAGTEVLHLPVSNSAVSRAIVTLPRQGVQVRTSGGLLLEKSESAAGSRWVAYGRGDEPLTFAWKRRVDDQRSTQPLRLRAALTQLVGLGEDTSQLNSEVQLEVLQGRATDVRLHLPDQFTVNQVSGAVVADWQVTSQELVVSFLDPVQSSTRFVVSGDIKLPRDGLLNVPMLRLFAAERETGGLGVEVLGAGEIKDRKATGLEETEAAELGQLIANRQSPSLLGFRLRPADGKSERSLSIRVDRYTPQAVLTANIEEARYNVLFSEGGKLLVQARLAIRNNQRNFLKVTLPTSATFWSAAVDNRPVRPGTAPDGSLLLPLEKTKSADEAPPFSVDIVYVDRAPVWTERGRARLSLLALDLPVSKSGLVIHYPPGYRVNPLAGSFRTTAFEPAATPILRATTHSQSSGASPTPTTPAVSGATRDLIERAQVASHARSALTNLPIRVAFPHFGPSVYLVSELTGENQAPTVDLDFQREKKRGE